MTQNQIKQYIIDACRTENVPSFEILELDGPVAVVGHRDYFAGVGGVTKTRLLHSALGMMTEIAELETALANDDRVNVLEELGDVAWYWAIGVHALDVVVPNEDEVGEPERPVAKELCVPYLVAAICTWGDIIRRHAIHGKKLDSGKAHDALLDLYWEMQRTAKALDISIDEVFEKNIAKLKVADALNVAKL